MPDSPYCNVLYGKFSFRQEPEDKYVYFDGALLTVPHSHNGNVAVGRLYHISTKKIFLQYTMYSIEERSVDTFCR